MYSALHYLRRKPSVPVGFIHLPYDARQSPRHRSLASLPIATMEDAVRIAIAVTARSLA
jgi:pyrrolidone-carboxylate peptidase